MNKHPEEEGTNTREAPVSKSEGETKGGVLSNV